MKYERIERRWREGDQQQGSGVGETVGERLSRNQGQSCMNACMSL